MKKYRLNSFKARTILLFSGINILLILFVARFSYLFVRELFLSQAEDQLRLSLRVVASELDLSMLDFITEQKNTLADRYYRQTLTRLDSTLQLSNLFLFNAKKQIVQAVKAEDAAASLLIYRPQLQGLKIKETFITAPFKGLDGVWYLWAYQRLNQNYYIGLQESANRLAQVDRLAVRFLWFGLIGVLITFLAGWFIARTINRPVQNLIHFSGKIGKGDFAAQPSQTGLYEISILTDALTKMRDELAERESEKEQLLAQIAHELRNPLGGIELLAGLIRDDLDPDDKNRVYLQKILNEVRGLKTQITEFLNYSRPRPPEISDSDLESVINELRERWNRQFQSGSIDFRCELEAKTIPFDRQHLLQILNNLIANSLAAMNNKNGQILIRSSEQNGKIILQVEDTGQGIPDSDRERVFQPFFTTRNNGVGLGLTICKKLCILNGASIEALSGNEGGTIIRITRDKKFSGN
ncbi:MAG: HAMP domain-containing histidine kinase [Calditrichaeota bacterium]|nr:HAMP domain-containing histidine kinase [Calditrichota bacterium]